MDEELPIAVAAARAAGEVLRAGLGRPHQVAYKGAIDLVTEVDGAAEACVVGLLGAATPSYGFLTEENAPVPGTADGRWIVDPLDGTTNYAHGCPRFCVSIALERAGELQVAVVYDPLRDELYAAQRGCGATLNGRPIKVSGTAALAGALVNTGFPYDVWTSERNNVAETAHFLRQVQALRVTGSAALDLAAVACGRSDAYWEHGLAPYDVAAGILLVREAGGLATDYDGGANALYGREIVAANPALHAEMVGYLRTRRG
ncbi:MAG TPA: inositol monophosphatase family protein [Anaerolineae bacterium]|nr:inositol monophosphatase family protein [Anaerolineae bacterium]HOQ98474.1 inositol monophosphatase family protein [Anaerolineae bacterium]HPL29264.1 inositol monophosphatase family protein [Anaerolineae bacterium]